MLEVGKSVGRRQDPRTNYLAFRALQDLTGGERSLRRSGGPASAAGGVVDVPRVSAMRTAESRRDYPVDTKRRGPQHVPLNQNLPPTVQTCISLWEPTLRSTYCTFKFVGGGGFGMLAFSISNAGPMRWPALVVQPANR